MDPTSTFIVQNISQPQNVYHRNGQLFSNPYPSPESPPLLEHERADGYVTSEDDLSSSYTHGSDSSLILQGNGHYGWSPGDFKLPCYPSSQRSSRSATSDYDANSVGIESLSLEQLMNEELQNNTYYNYRAQIGESLARESLRSSPEPLKSRARFAVPDCSRHPYRNASPATRSRTRAAATSLVHRTNRPSNPASFSPQQMARNPSLRKQRNSSATYVQAMPGHRHMMPDDWVLDERERHATLAQWNDQNFKSAHDFRPARTEPSTPSHVSPAAQSGSNVSCQQPQPVIYAYPGPDGKYYDFSSSQPREIVLSHGDDTSVFGVQTRNGTVPDRSLPIGPLTGDEAASVASLPDPQSRDVPSMEPQHVSSHVAADFNTSQERGAQLRDSIVPIPSSADLISDSRSPPQPQQTVSISRRKVASETPPGSPRKRQRCVNDTSLHDDVDDENRRAANVFDANNSHGKMSSAGLAEAGGPGSGEVRTRPEIVHSSGSLKSAESVRTVQEAKSSLVVEATTCIGPENTGMKTPQRVDDWVADQSAETARSMSDAPIATPSSFAQLPSMLTSPADSGSAGSPQSLSQRIRLYFNDAYHESDFPSTRPHLLHLGDEDARRVFDMLSKDGPVSMSRVLDFAQQLADSSALLVAPEDFTRIVEDCNYGTDEPLDLYALQEVMFVLCSGLDEVATSTTALTRFNQNLLTLDRGDQRSQSGSNESLKSDVKSPTSLSLSGSERQYAGYESSNNCGSTQSSSVQNRHAKGNATGSKRGHPDDGFEQGKGPSKRTASGPAGHHGDPKREGNMRCVVNGCAGIDRYISGLIKGVKHNHNAAICSICYDKFDSAAELSNHRRTQCHRHCLSGCHTSDSRDRSTILARRHPFVPDQCPGRPSNKDQWRYIYALVNVECTEVPDPDYIDSDVCPHGNRMSPLNRRARELSVQRNEDHSHCEQELRRVTDKLRHCESLLKQAEQKEQTHVAEKRSLLNYLEMGLPTLQKSDDPRDVVLCSIILGELDNMKAAAPTTGRKIEIPATGSGGGGAAPIKDRARAPADSRQELSNTLSPVQEMESGTQPVADESEYLHVHADRAGEVTTLNLAKDTNFALGPESLNRSQSDPGPSMPKTTMTRTQDQAHTSGQDLVDLESYDRLMDDFDFEAFSQGMPGDEFNDSMS